MDAARSNAETAGHCNIATNMFESSRFKMAHWRARPWLLTQLPPQLPLCESDCCMYLTQLCGIILVLNNTILVQYEYYTSTIQSYSYCCKRLFIPSRVLVRTEYRYLYLYHTRIWYIKVIVEYSIIILFVLGSLSTVPVLYSYTCIVTGQVE